MTTPRLTTEPVAEVSVHVIGDIGGVGISRFRFIRNDAGVLTVADCNAAGAAVRSMYNSSNNFPTGVQVQVQATVEQFDIGTGLVQPSLVMSSIPAAVVGSVAGNYGAGVGARINWKTATVVGRRMLRGATFMVPYGNTAFSGNGAVNGTAVGVVTSAAQAYIAAMATANLVPVIWHRPTAESPSGGVVGPVTGAACPTTPAGLRSRRS